MVVESGVGGPVSGGLESGGFVCGEADDVGMEAHGFPVVPHAGVSAVRVKEPAEAVGDESAFGALGIGGPARLSIAVRRCGGQVTGVKAGCISSLLRSLLLRRASSHFAKSSRDE